MTTSAPPPPSYRSIFVGVALALVLIVALLRVAEVVKWSGAALMFLPSQLGLVDMALPDDLVQVEFSVSPSTVRFAAPGAYLLYANDYDLLVINDAVLESDAPPWLVATDSAGDPVDLELIERGLIPFDTPFAPGRPVARLTISDAGEFSLVHPRRPTQVHLVPDYLTGRVGFLTILAAVQMAMIGFGAYSIMSRGPRARRKRAKAHASASIRRIEASQRRQAAKREDADQYEEQNVWRPRR